MYGLVKKRSNGANKEVVYKRTIETSNLTKAKRFNELERQICLKKLERLKHETNKNLSRYTAAAHDVKDYYEKLRKSEMKLVDDEAISKILGKDSVLGCYVSIIHDKSTQNNT